ncbi:MAG TPA: SpoIIE family protein phosphatase [Candidatus Angelobacter sp.]|nr:SpoIIE family protein phosphatase [Candidatus Angelobacter sp.]
MNESAVRTKDTQDGSERKEPHLRVHCINIYVRDQDQSLSFYLDQLGFDLAFDAQLPSGDRWVAVAPPDGSAILALVAPKPESETYKLIGRSTDVVFVTEDVMAKYNQWLKRGVRFQHVPRLRRIKFDHQLHSRKLNPSSSGSSSSSGSGQAPVWGGVFTRFKDIDGNSFALVSFDEFTQALEEERRAVAEKQEAERRTAQELEIAKQVQARLFPQVTPTLQTLEYSGICIQARQVGGDYYDFLDLGQERMGFVIGDIAGKGIAAALLMANLQANLRSQTAIACDQPQRLLLSVNQLFCQNTADAAYASLFFGQYDDRSGHFRYANCGHLSGLLLRKNHSVERLESNCTVLGLFKDWTCTFHEQWILPGDLLALYTDGVTESFSASGEEFGEERLIEALRRHSKMTPQRMLTSIIQEVKEFMPHEQHDDITLIVAKRNMN